MKNLAAWATAAAIVIGLSGFVWLILKIGSCSPGTPTPPRAATLDNSAEVQGKRHLLIDRLIDEGIFSKVEPGATVPKAWTGPRWWLLPFDEKQTVVGVVYAYYFDGPYAYYSDRADETALVQVKDGMTGKVVGDYSLSQGGLKMR